MRANNVLTAGWARSLRTRLLIVFVTLGVVPTVMIGLWGYRFSAERLTEAEGNRLAQEALIQGDHIDRVLFERYGDVKAFAANPLSQGSPSERQKLLNLLTVNYRIYDLMVLVDTTGKVISANTVDRAGNQLDTADLVGRDVSDHDWFTTIVGGGTPEGGAVYGPAHHSELVTKVYGADRLTLPFSAPIYDDTGDLVGVWHNEASFDQIVVGNLRQLQNVFLGQGAKTIEAHLLGNDDEHLAHLFALGGSVEDDDAEMDHDDLAGHTNSSRDDIVNRSASQALGSDETYGYTVETDPQTGTGYINGFATTDGVAGFAGYAWKVIIRQASAEAAAPAADQRDSMVVAGAFILLVTVLVAVGLARAIALPLRQNVDKLVRVAHGDLTVEFDVGSKDEVGQMSSALNKAVASIRTTLGEVESSAGLLTKSAAGLMRFSGDMSDAATQTSDQASEVAGAAEQIASSSHSVALAMDEMSESIHEISASTSKAAQMTSKAVEASNGAKSRMEQLDLSATDIGNVVSVINSIASQTDLLALNATIEAARVGEAGKGFAVVASEVKALARQTAEATHEIQAKIDAIQSDAKEAVTVIGEIAALVDRVNEASTVIAGAVEEQSATSAEVSASIMAMTDGTSSISRNIVTVAEAASATRSGAANAEEASLELSTMATRLQSSLSQFKVAMSAHGVDSHSSKSDQRLASSRATQASASGLSKGEAKPTSDKSPSPINASAKSQNSEHVGTVAGPEVDPEAVWQKSDPITSGDWETQNGWESHDGKMTSSL